jgi:short-subunit dehydrogenase
MGNVLITGASSGLGAAIAKQFASRGDSLYLVARRKALLEDLKAELLATGAPSVDYRVVDLEDETQVQQLADDPPKIGVDVLINNAAFGQWDYSWDTTPAKMRAMIAVNVSAVAVLSVAFSQIKHEQPARLMNVASGAGYALFESSIPYSASKFFVTALTEGIAQELCSKELPMRAQLLAPGPIATDFMMNAMQGSKIDMTNVKGMDKIQFHTPEQVAEFAMQLYDSDAVVGGVQPDMSFILSGGLHQVGQLFDE